MPNKQTYLVKPGRQLELTVAELSAVIPDCTFIEFKFGYLKIETEQTVDQKLINQLGSVPQIYKLITTRAEINNFTDSIEPKTGTFSLNWIPEKMFKPEDKKNQLKQLKKYIKENTEGKTRYLNQGPQNVKTAYAIDQGLLRGKLTDYTILKWDDHFLILETIGLQDINSYSHRDFSKPARDMERGMFPPKLAQILINLGLKTNHDQTIYDPFCGLGVIAMEASLNGITTINSDIDQQAITDTETNLRWLNQKYQDSSFNWHAYQADATTLTERPQTTDKITIITEGYLGPIIKNPINDQDPPAHIAEIEDMYLNFLKSAQKILKQNETIVFCLPAFRTQSKKVHLCKNIVENLEKLGYIKQALVPDDTTKNLDLKLTERETIVYMRHNQNIGREIIVAQKS